MAEPAFYSTLRTGSSGPDVALVQTWINGLRSRWPALPSLTVDGNYGSGTAAAVRQFQCSVGISADGVTGQTTWNTLYNNYADLNGEGEQFPGVSIRRGNKAATVRSAQARLNALGARLTADGNFGAATETAVKVFQAANGLTADGVIGRSTWNRLYNTN
ncbi:MAG: peptidoglycan-binding protein [Faecalibacterium sp.]|nr:peptidoglycan-binding protein [Faecalibacterium sp.]